jgi:hypothetical protein
MLVSHTHKFIYLKTKKTGGTSVEAYLEQFCLPPNVDNVGGHNREETISEYGIVGGRNYGRSIKNDTYYNHMPAQELKDLLGSDTWNNYRKFCVIRNPWDRMVSKFWWTLQSQLLKYEDKPFSEIREYFEWWIENKPRWLADDIEVFTIEGKVIVDDVIRYEELDKELARICNQMGESYLKEDLPKYKAGVRKRSDPYQDYYSNPKTKAIVEQAHSVWISHFGYTF